MVQITEAYELPIGERLERILEDKSNYFMIPVENQVVRSKGLEPKIVRLTKFPVIDIGYNGDDSLSMIERAHSVLSRYGNLISSQTDALNALFLLLSDKKIFDGNGHELKSNEGERILDYYLSITNELLNTVFKQHHSLSDLFVLEHDHLSQKGKYEDIIEVNNILMESCYIDLNPENFNHHGLPLKNSKSKIQEYKRGENIKYVAYIPPIENIISSKKTSVARIKNSKGEAILDLNEINNNSRISQVRAKLLGDI